MADFITPVIDILTRLCGYRAKWADSIRQLGDNLESLGNASDQLNSRYLDVKMKVQMVEQDANPELMVLNEVRHWMGRAEALQNQVQAILQQGNQEIKAKCFGGRCPKNCRASYKLQKVVTHKLIDVNDLISKGHFDVVAEKFARDRFSELPVDKAVGVESTFEELCSCFEDNRVGIIGLHGMGGVGKTTLLKKFNNDFLSRKANIVVIWVVVSKDADPGKIQDAIRKQLRVRDDIWNNKTMDERANLLYNGYLKKNNFVLLLDDVWERIDLVKLGVPSPNNQDCKIIFTTRSEEVCRLMEAKRYIEVNCLTPNKAFDLFKEKVGATTLDENPHIVPFAKQVVKECRGLPLALCTVGRAMANKVTPSEWKRTIEFLRSDPSNIQGIVKDVYHLLEFSYDRLPNDTYKSCFLYCALYPEDYNIPKEEIILLWIAEGFLDYDIHKARMKAEDIISSLKYACLLENGKEKNTIKMHDVIRDMALWLACDHGKKTRFIVQDRSITSGLEVYKDATWKEVERLSMWGRGEVSANLSQKPHCPSLVTLLLRNTKIKVFPTDVFVLPPSIRVLDLSDNKGITNLPSAIGDFVSLEHLNLSGTKITKLPEELKNLKMLRLLLLDQLGKLEFPKEVISNLQSLQAFSTWMGWGFPLIGENLPFGLWTPGWDFPLIDENLVLHELEGLNNLQDLLIRVCSISSVKKILVSSKLQRCLCQLSVKASSLLHDLFSSLGNMKHLETLQVEGDRGLENSEVVNIPRRSFSGHEYVISLRKLDLNGCIVDLNWLIYAPNLEVLVLSHCASLVEVISEDLGTTADTESVKSNLFSSLSYLNLRSMSNLRSICKIAWQFPFLEEIHVFECPNLKKLPFNSQSELKNIRWFEAEREWEINCNGKTKLPRIFFHQNYHIL